MKAWLGFTRTRLSLAGWVISRVTGGLWHHGFIAFGLEGPEVYYEAHAMADDGPGFRGPKPISKLHAWADKPGHIVELLDVTRLADRGGGVYRMLQWCDEEARFARRGYDVWQLVRIWASRRFLRRWGFAMQSNDAKTICSEAQTRALIAGGCNLSERYHVAPDDMSPSDVYNAAKMALAETKK